MGDDEAVQDPGDDHGEEAHQGEGCQQVCGVGEAGHAVLVRGEGQEAHHGLSDEDNPSEGPPQLGGVDSQQVSCVRGGARPAHHEALGDVGDDQAVQDPGEGGQVLGVGEDSHTVRDRGDDQAAQGPRDNPVESDRQTSSGRVSKQKRRRREPSRKRDRQEMKSEEKWKSKQERKSKKKKRKTIQERQIREEEDYQERRKKLLHIFWMVHIHRGTNAEPASSQEEGQGEEPAPLPAQEQVEQGGVEEGGAIRLREDYVALVYFCSC